MRTVAWLGMGWLAGIMLLAPVARAQPRPYIGYVYPGGGQQGKTFRIRLGGQNIDDVNAVLVTGGGVTTRVVEYYWRQNNQEQALLKEQLQILKRKYQPDAGPAKPNQAWKSAAPAVAAERAAVDPAMAELMDRIGQRTDEFVQTPASASVAALLFVEVTIAPDAAPGDREIRLATVRGVSNPLRFQVGQLPEYARKAMRTATIQVLGKEAQALRKRPPQEGEERVALPCYAERPDRFRRGKYVPVRRPQGATPAIQHASAAVDSLHCRRRPRLVSACAGAIRRERQRGGVRRRLPVQARPDDFLRSAQRRRIRAWRSMTAIYRGREDFVYRITVGENCPS